MHLQKASGDLIGLVNSIHNENLLTILKITFFVHSLKNQKLYFAFIILISFNEREYVIEVVGVCVFIFRKVSGS